MEHYCQRPDGSYDCPTWDQCHHRGVCLAIAKARTDGRIPPPTKVGISVECARCHRTKAPRGRSLSYHLSYCLPDECPGYNLEPFAGDLFPGETDADFGYPCSDYGTRQLAGRS